MYIDLFIAILLIWSLFNGWRNGFLKEIISSIGFLAGLLVAALFYSTLGEYLAVNGSESNMLTSIVAFFILWILVPIVLGLAANVLTKALKGMRLGLPNSLLGMAVSFIKFLILISCVLNVMDGLRILDPRKTETSKLYRPVTGVLGFMFDKAVHSLPHTGDGEADGQQSDTVWVDFSSKSPNKK